MKIPVVLLGLVMLVMLLVHCGETPINIDERTYVPKIVVEGYLFPDQPVKNIRITRNFPLNREIELAQIIIDDAAVTLTDVQQGIVYRLRYNPENFAYDYPGTDLSIDFAHAYRLEVAATIDNQPLRTASTTTVPDRGFEIIPEKSRLLPLQYRQKDNQGHLQSFVVAFYRSPNTTFYVLSMQAMEASSDNFITANPYGVQIDEVDEEMLQELAHQSRWVEVVIEGTMAHYLEVPWLLIWFYGRYQAILYAGDKNFKDYFLTHNRIQDLDGNLYEPKFHFEGDGIGVFGSAIADTIYFEVIR